MQNVFTLEALISWLKSKPADGDYYWPSCRECLIASYLRERGVVDKSGGIRFAEVCGGLSAYHYIAASKPWTFGAALMRAKEWQARPNGYAYGSPAGMVVGGGGEDCG